MDAIDAALRSLEDSLDKLNSRLRGTEQEHLQLFRARIMMDETQARIAAARANGTIGPGWGAEFVDQVNAAAMLVAICPADGGPPFHTALQAVQDVLAAIQAALPHAIT